MKSYFVKYSVNSGEAYQDKGIVRCTCEAEAKAFAKIFDKGPFTKSYAEVIVVEFKEDQT